MLIIKINTITPATPAPFKYDGYGVIKMAVARLTNFVFRYVRMNKSSIIILTLIASMLMLISSASYGQSAVTEDNNSQIAPYSDQERAQYFQCQSMALISFEEESKRPKASLSTLNYFGTSITITLYDVNKNDALPMLCNALNVVQEYHYLASNYSTYPHVTNIKTINQSPSAIHKISPKLTELIDAGLKWHQQSQGYFNIALSPVINLWRSARNRCTKGEEQQRVCELPNKQAIKKALALTDIKQITLDSTNNTITMAEGMEIDLGGIAKGWMAEKVLEQLMIDGAKRIMINAGGNIRHYGIHPSGRQFTTAIEDPLCKKSDYQLEKCSDVAGQFYEFITGKDLTLVSSGNYLRYFKVDGVEYHHLIDPNTGYPTPSGVSVSVILTDQHIHADVISTMLFLMPLKAATEYVNQRNYIEAVWYLDKDGNKLYSDNFQRLRLKQDEQGQ